MMIVREKKQNCVAAKLDSFSVKIRSGFERGYILLCDCFADEKYWS